MKMKDIILLKEIEIEYNGEFSAYQNDGIYMEVPIRDHHNLYVEYKDDVAIMNTLIINNEIKTLNIIL